MIANGNTCSLNYCCIIEKSSFYFYFFQTIMRGPLEVDAQLMTWYEVRDALIGANNASWDVKKAFALAAPCTHPEALWLKRLFIRHDCQGPGIGFGAKRVFVENGSAQALCLAALIHFPDESLLRRAAVEGSNALAQAYMANRTQGEESFEFARKSAAQRERDGFYHLGLCFRDGIGCDKDVERAKENFATAAGNVFNLKFWVCLDLFIQSLDTFKPWCFIVFPLANQSPSDWFGWEKPHLPEMLCRFCVKCLKLLKALFPETTSRKLCL
jgi:hypothetical protein